MKENIFSHFPTRKTIFFIFLSCIFVNYKYLLEEGGEGTSYFNSTYASEKRIDRDKFNKRILKFKHSPDYKLDIVHPLS